MCSKDMSEVSSKNYVDEWTLRPLSLYAKANGKQHLRVVEVVGSK